MSNFKQHTNSKLFRKAVQNHINSIRTESIENHVKQWLKEVPPRPGMSYQDAFIEWCTGLPTAFYVLYVNQDIIDELEKWFNKVNVVLTEKDKEKLLEDNETMNYYVYLIFREIKPYIQEVERKMRV